jgi:CubicO group peptidase (beta-lactamase class C family)
MKLRHLIGAAVCGIGASALLHAQPALPPDAAASDPRLLKWMEGSPPAAEKTIRFGDGSFYSFPRLRWSFSHMRELVPTVNVWRGDGRPSTLLHAERSELDALAFTTLDGKSSTWGESLALNYTDGIVVLHRGRIVYERYFGALEPQRQHAAFSVTKSFVGLLAAMLAHESRLDPAAPVTNYVPELKDSAYGDATVRQVMDMTIGVKYSENYTDPKAEVFDYARAGSLLPRPPGYQGPQTFYQFLVSLQKEGEHGQAFAYKTSNAEVLAWIVKRASGKPFAELLSERIWRKIGAENDAYVSVDSIGVESGGGGLHTTLRDLARVGEMMRNDGQFNGQQVVAKEVVRDIRNGASKEHFAKGGYATLPGGSYRNMWWIFHNEHGAYGARGIHGQAIYIDPKAEMVIARYASNWRASNALNDPVSLPAYLALAKHLMR